MELNKFFSSPVYWENASQFLYLDKVCNSYIEEVKKEDDFVYHSKNTLFFNKEFIDFINYIDLKSTEFLDTQGFNTKNHKRHFSEMWVQEFNKKGGGNHSKHIHWNSHISGFYFLKAGKNTSYPIFHDPRSAAVMYRLPVKNESTINEASDSFHLKVKPGTLVLFNSYLPHEFVTDRGLEPFRFIHFNIQFISENII